jgi:hypothetical protein
VGDSAPDGSRNLKISLGYFFRILFFPFFLLFKIYRLSLPSNFNKTKENVPVSKQLLVVALILNPKSELIPAFVVNPT